LSGVRGPGGVPPLAMLLGHSGLLPPVACVVAIAGGDPTIRFSALALLFAYVAVILSFLGGIWWGFAAREGERAPGWLWVAAVAPSLVAVASAWPWAVGLSWPGPSLVALGVAMLLTLLVDRRLTSMGIAPADWMRLRVPLSLGLGSLSILGAIL